MFSRIWVHFPPQDGLWDLIVQYKKDFEGAQKNLGDSWNSWERKRERGDIPFFLLLAMDMLSRAAPPEWSEGSRDTINWVEATAAKTRHLFLDWTERTKRSTPTCARAPGDEWTWWLPGPLEARDMRYGLMWSLRQGAHTHAFFSCPYFRWSRYEQDRTMPEILVPDTVAESRYCDADM